MNNSFELLVFLKEKKLLENSPEFWWPSHGCFETLVGAILTQNTKWSNVEKSLVNLKSAELLTLERMANVDIEVLIFAITPSGFKNQKAVRLKQLCKNIIGQFGNFENFQKTVTRDWLLEQKGIGCESADAILCYTCAQDEMVVDKYTHKLLKSFGYEFESYEQMKAWCEYGINEYFDKIVQIYGFDITLNKIYCRLHGKIVEFMKNNPRV
ncbi:MAG: 3-methyladenine DNA glycosylase [Candidatus Marinarcus sp.]|uniref:3-methyladenine DNA glycosylase n=1 Tax=Candidatus Marinarcus sp. TaxID=3100987 RepID=UPI003B0028F5